MRRLRTLAILVVASTILMTTTSCLDNFEWPGVQRQRLAYEHELAVERMRLDAEASRAARAREAMPVTLGVLGTILLLAVIGALVWHGQDVRATRQPTVIIRDGDTERRLARLEQEVYVLDIRGDAYARTVRDVQRQLEARHRPQLPAGNATIAVYDEQGRQIL